MNIDKKIKINQISKKDNLFINKINYNKLFKTELLKYKTSKEFFDNNRIYYHGTFSTFKNFSLENVGKNTEYDNAMFGIFFSDCKESVKEFLDITRTPEKGNGTIKEVFVIIQNPLNLTIKGIFTNKKQAPLLLKLLGNTDSFKEEEALEFIDDNIGLGEIQEFMEGIYQNPKNKLTIQRAGYDGIISEFGKDEKGDIIKEYVTFNINQIFAKELIEENYKILKEK